MSLLNKSGLTFRMRGSAVHVVRKIAALVRKFLPAFKLSNLYPFVDLGKYMTKFVNNAGKLC